MSTGKFNAAGSPAMDYPPIQRGVEILLGVHALEISAGVMGHLLK